MHYLFLIFARYDGVIMLWWCLSLSLWWKILILEVYLLSNVCNGIPNNTIYCIHLYSYLFKDTDTETNNISFLVQQLLVLQIILIYNIWLFCLYSVCMIISNKDKNVWTNRIKILKIYQIKGEKSANRVHKAKIITSLA